MSGKIAELCGRVVEVIDFLGSNARHEQAQELRTLLLESSPVKAHQACQNKGYLKELQAARKAAEIKAIVTLDEWEKMDEDRQRFLQFGATCRMVGMTTQGLAVEKVGRSYSNGRGSCVTSSV